MKRNRRDFLRKTTLGAGVVATGSMGLMACTTGFRSNTSQGIRPLVISTWEHGQAANAAAWKLLQVGGAALDAVEAGVRVPESDPQVRTVGLGGFPDREGRVTLDACIMDHLGRGGSVAFLQYIENPVSVARKVMDTTPHVMLVGEGALQFALSQGFKRTNLLTEKSRADWEKWLEKSQYEPVINIENHDTIGMLALDAQGNLSGACTTSGAAYKMHGRVGDSPIIGAGLFVDNEVGAACATGLGEVVMRAAGSAMVVEMMRNGATPQQACESIVRRIHRQNSNAENLQVGFLALDKNGNYGAYALRSGFNYAVCSAREDNILKDAGSEIAE